MSLHTRARCQASPDFWLNYTLKSTLSRSGLAANLGGAQTEANVRRDWGDGNGPIRAPFGADGRSYYERNRVAKSIKD